MPIAELAAGLAGNRLHVVVFGPGYGECIGVHVPDAGWLICDSLSGTGRQADFVPAVELLDQRQERAAVLLLTHPHDDHVAGFDRLVTRFATGLIGLVGVHLAQDDFTEGDDAAAVLAQSNRHKALASIQRYWREHPEFKWELTADGSARSLGPALIEVLHPDQSYLSAGRPNPAKAPNAYSTPILVAWRDTRIILGADLPSAEWNTVLKRAREPHLADHHAYKVSHHGSMKSVAEDLVRATDQESLAAVTPWHLGGRYLPELGDGGGVAWLLERRSSVGLTSPARALTRPLPQPVPHSLLAGSVARRTLPGGLAIDVKQSYDPDECWIALTFARNGEVESVQFGREARLIVRG